MLSNRIHPLLVTGLFVFSLLSISCSISPSKEEVAAKQAQIKLAEERREAERLAAEKKLRDAARKKAAEQEDAIQTTDIKMAASLEAEKLPETQAKPSVVSAATSTLEHEIPTEPDTYLITMMQKDRTHPFFDVGDERGLLVNGEQGKYIIARRNQPVTFKVRTNPMHDFYISTSSKGWGATAYRAGVTGQFIYNGEVTITTNLNTPDTLYYSCRNHNSMGGKIVVVDENTDIAALEQKLNAEREAQWVKNKAIAEKSIDPKKVKQKITYVGMLIQFKGKGLPPAQLSSIEEALNSAKTMEAAGDLSGALSAAQNAEALFAVKAVDTGPSEEELAEQKEGFNDLLVTLEAFIDAHLASYKQAKEEERKTVAYDSEAVGDFILEARNLAEQLQYDAAGKQIKKAERMVTGALNQMLNAQTIVYDLNFKTQADEYKYEVNRYKGYEELIPVAIEVKKPPAGAIKFAKTYQEKAEFFKDKSRDAADAERWEEALVVIKDATIEIRRALRILGVSM